jgi:hypothetical protein
MSDIVETCSCGASITLAAVHASHLAPFREQHAVCLVNAAPPGFFTATATRMDTFGQQVLQDSQSITAMDERVTRILASHDRLAARVQELENKP